MTDRHDDPTATPPETIFDQLRAMQGDAMAQLFAPFAPGGAGGPADPQRWAEVAGKLNAMWVGYQSERMAEAGPAAARLFDPMEWARHGQAWYARMPFGDPETTKRLWEDALSLSTAVLGQYGIGPAAGEADGDPKLPRADRRFADPKWRAQPMFALIHQTYLMLAEQVVALADKAPGLDAQQKQQLKFATQAIVDAASPAHFPLTNPLVIERTLATRGENLVKGMEHLIADLKKGQLTHTDPDAFELGRNIAVTPGKVVHETPLYQLIQYTPTTGTVLATPLLIFPPWINRFYILDLNEKKSFIRWAVAQGVSVFVVSWKSADASLAETIWDDYVLAQIDAIDTVRKRLGTPAVHAIGYCVAGTTLAATLAYLARHGEADKVKSATFFTAQVDFERSGELRLMVDDAQLALVETLATDGTFDGRLMAATFNMLRGPDLIWNYVINNYLMGDDYPAFDLLHWNGDVTNLPAKWHQAYLKDLYRDNKLVEPDALSIAGTPLDLGRIETPIYIQAGKEDHIAPAESVWRITRHVKGKWKFVLAGSGHIAGVVNPPDAGKYQYWTNPSAVSTLDEFVAGATETKGSWWPDWVEWLKAHDPATVPATAKRAPGGKGDKVIENAPGRYVMTR